ncbi:non-ribosomal peptide synthetase [Amycolatopsis magusensis]|uniref:Amino acid adenylation domain-containing protein n=1 Tax=Amycolatopsis magusensis TaxID=882444 RepID=A0ABS4Q225_9PSEU|nr:non-ribosomal peptide synthetase [Amycolatopsis magusensis]MBP2184871.1 amino acid adenylation domain-containing protein [Amycolatopsis magusensis]
MERTHPHFPLVCEDSTPSVSGGHALPLASGAVLLGALLAQAMAYAGPREVTVRTDTEHTLRLDGTVVGDFVAMAAPVAGARAGFRVVLDPEPADLALTFVFADELTVECAARPRDPAALDRIAAHYLAFLRAAISMPDREVAAVDHRTAAEKQVAARLNDTTRDLTHPPCLHELFEAAADRDPDALALVQGDTRLRFGELEARANGLAARLTGTRIGILATLSVEFVVCALAVLKAGAAYVPLDPKLPDQRLRTLFRLGHLTSLLADPEYAEIATSLTDSWVPVPSGVTSRDRPTRRGTGSDLAYLIFTSGSTGEPKGALLDHAGRANMITDLNQRFGLGPGDRMLVVSSPSFDMSVYDLFGTLAAGATAVLPDRGREQDVDHWARLLVDERVTLWHSVPSALSLVLNLLPSRVDSVRLVLAGGDWIPVDQPSRVHRAFPGAEFYSLGGATEVSVDSVIHRVAPGERFARAIPYGRPLTNQTARVLDRYGREAALDLPGELVLGGVGVGQGYDRRPRLTAERFPADPFRPGARMYRTGDAARLRADGTIELLGRLDQQIKLEGVRIEPGEIQTAIEADDRVREAVVAPRRDASGRAVALVAFVVPDGDPGTLLAELPVRLRSTLHRSSIPGEFRLIERIPLNANGKVDRTWLAAMADQVPEPEVSEVDTVDAVDEFAEAVAEVWTQVLGLAGPPAAHDRFAALGGGSLAATQVVSRLRRRFGTELSVREVLTRPTVAGVAEILRSRAPS